MTKKSKGPHSKLRKQRDSTAEKLSTQQQGTARTVRQRALRFGKVALSILGLLGAATAVELLPRFSVSPEPPDEWKNSVPSVSVKNDGYLKLAQVKATCVIWKYEDAHGTKLNKVSGLLRPGGEELATSQTLTTTCGTRIDQLPANIKTMDIGVIVYFKPWPLTFLRSHRVYRLVGQQTGKGLVWYKQPPGEEMEKYADDLIEELPDFFK